MNSLNQFFLFYFNNNVRSKNEKQQQQQQQQNSPKFEFHILYLFKLIEEEKNAMQL